jgi:salicylate hydroxylase
MTTKMSEKRLKVAVIGGGPGGLGAAIELAKLPFVDWELYEKKPQISETGGGMSLQPHTWRLLEHNGAARNIEAKDFYRGQTEQRRCAPSPSHPTPGRTTY